METTLYSPKVAPNSRGKPIINVAFGPVGLVLTLWGRAKGSRASCRADCFRGCKFIVGRHMGGSGCRYWRLAGLVVWNV